MHARVMSLSLTTTATTQYPATERTTASNPPLELGKRGVTSSSHFSDLPVTLDTWLAEAHLHRKISHLATLPFGCEEICCLELLRITNIPRLVDVHLSATSFPILLPYYSTSGSPMVAEDPRHATHLVLIGVVSSTKSPSTRIMLAWFCF